MTPVRSAPAKARAGLAPWAAGAGLAALLALWANRGAFLYWLRDPGVLGLDSLKDAAVHSALPLLAAAGVCGLAWTIGAGLLSLLRPETAEEAERHASAFALGAGVWASGIFCLGALGILRPGPLLALSIALAACGAAALLRPKRRRSAPAGPAPLHPAVKAVLAFVMVYALWDAWIQALAPVSDADALIYHLVFPKLHLQEGRLAFLPWIYISCFPHLANLLYVTALALGSENIASLMHWTCAAVLLRAIFRVAASELDKRTGWIGAALFAALPIFGEMAGVPRLEFFWALFHFLAFAAAWRWRRTGASAWLVQAGLLAGMAAATKLMGIASLALLCAWIPLQRERGPLAERVRAAALLLACGLLIAAPWYIKTWIQTGSPVWPFFPAIFGDELGAAYLAPRIKLSHQWPEWTDLGWLLQYDPQYLLIPLGLAAGWILLDRRARRAWPAFLTFHAATFAPYLAAVVWDLNLWRYLTPWLPAMVLTTAWGISRMLDRGRLGRCAAAAALAVALFPVLLLSRNNQLFAVLELRSKAAPEAAPRELYMERIYPPYAFYRDVNRWHASAGRPPVKLLLFYEEKGYLLDMPYMLGHPFMQGLVPYSEIPDSRALLERLRGLGVTHVMINMRGGRYVNPRAMGLMAGMLAKSGPPLAVRGPRRLYALRNPSEQ